MHEYFVECLVRDRQHTVRTQAVAARDRSAARKEARAARRAARRGNVVEVRPKLADLHEHVVPRQRPTFDDAA
jgi:hypothetical protein